MAGLYHGWDHEEDNHADFKHGGVGIEDFESPRHKKKSLKKKTGKRGCPGNDFGPHVYIWIDWDGRQDSLWFRDNTYEIKVCCGCEKRAGSKSFRRKQ